MNVDLNNRLNENQVTRIARLWVALERKVLQGNVRDAKMIAREIRVCQISIGMKPSKIKFR